MKKHISILLLLGVASSVAQAAAVDIRRAALRVQKAVGGQWSVLPAPKSQAAPAHLYVLTNGSNEIIVTPVNDSLPAVLAQFNAEKFPAENTPAGWWLREMDQALSRGMKREFTSTRTEVIKPLVKAQWDQIAPFNKYLPKENDLPSYTGCVATALAQIFRTIKYAEGSGTKTWRGVTADFSHKWDWDNMPVPRGEWAGENDESALLMTYIGVAVNMNWGYADGSGAFSSEVPDAIIKWFGYDPENTVWVERRMFDDVTWEDLIIGELLAQRPLYYRGGGHVFILDGRRSDGLYHFNWGWGGKYDGYYDLYDLGLPNVGPGGGSGDFRSGHQIVRCAPPGVEVKDIKAVLTTTEYDASAGRIYADYQVRGFSQPDVISLESYLVVEDLLSNQIAATHQMNHLDIRKYNHAIKPYVKLANFAPELPAGYYRIYPAYTMDDVSTPTKATPMPGTPEYVWLTVNADGSREYSTTPVEPPVSSVEDAVVNPQPVYYNLQGTEVTKFVPGVYIKRTGSKVSKVIIK